MNASILADGEYGSHNPERTVTFRRRSAESITLSVEVSVMILCADAVIAAGLAAVLRETAGFQLVPVPERGELLGGPPPADVVLADYETALQMAESAPQWAKRLLVFTNCDKEAEICRVLERGVSGYLLYGVGLPMLFEAIRSVQRGGIALSPRVAARVTTRIQGKPLTTREKAVLEQLMLGLSNKLIASRLNVGVGTIKSHLRSILEKLHADSRTAAVIAAQRRGLLP